MSSTIKRLLDFAIILFALMMFQTATAGSVAWCGDVIAAEADTPGSEGSGDKEKEGEEEPDCE